MDGSTAYSYGLCYKTVEDGSLPAQPPSSSQTGSELNERYQHALEEMMSHVRKLGALVPSSSNDDVMASCQELELAARDFQEQASMFGRVIISEIGLPVERKTIQPSRIGGSLGGIKYIVGSILFKLGDASIFHGYPDPLRIAHKIQGHEHKIAGHRVVSHDGDYGCALVQTCFFSLTSAPDFKGHRITAMTLLPISRDTLIYGSHDAGGDCNVVTSDKEFLERITNVSLSMGLKLHRVVNGRARGGEAEIATCVDIEGHLGFDGRHYLLDYSRALPPAHKEARPDYDTFWPYYHLLRAEFVSRFGTPLSSDAFSGFQSPLAEQENKLDRQNIVAATLSLRTSVVERVAARIIESAHAKTDLFSINVSQVMHSFGLNIRYLGLVYRHLMVSYSKELRNTYTLIQGAALMRVLKNRLRMLWRATNGSESELLCVTRNTLNDFFGKQDTGSWLAKNSYVTDDLTNLYNFDSHTCKFVVSACLKDRNVVRGTVLERSKVSLRLVVLESLSRSAGLQIRDIHDAVERSYTHAVVFDALDFVFVERIKQLDVVDRAQGMKLYMGAMQLRETDRGYDGFLRAFFVVEKAYAVYPCDPWFAWLLAEICAQLWMCLRRNRVNVRERRSSDSADDQELIDAFEALAVRHFQTAVAASPPALRALAGFGHFLLELERESQAAEMLDHALSFARDADEVRHLSALRDLCRAREKKASTPTELQVGKESVALKESGRVQRLIARLRVNRGKNVVDDDAAPSPPTPSRSSKLSASLRSVKDVIVQRRKSPRSSSSRTSEVEHSGSEESSSTTHVRGAGADNQEHADVSLADRQSHL